VKKIAQMGMWEREREGEKGDNNNIMKKILRGNTLIDLWNIHVALLNAEQLNRKGEREKNIIKK